MYDLVWLSVQNDNSSYCPAAEDISRKVQRVSRQFHVEV